MSEGVVRQGVMSQGAITVQKEGPTLVLRLDRPDRANAYTASMLAGLDAGMTRAEADPETRVVVLTGAGDRAFSAGADREELAGREWTSVLALESARVFDRIRRSPLVTIAAINGAAVGGGLELALACDLRIAGERARFWLPETALGLLPAAGAIPLLPRLVGPLKARELILGGARWSAADALAAGLLTEVVPDADLMTAVRRWADRIAERDPTAIRLAKLALEEAWPTATGALDRVAQALLVRDAREPEGPLDT